MGTWPGGITAITLFVEDLATAKAFYGRAFGLPVTYEDDNSARVAWRRAAQRPDGPAVGHPDGQLPRPGWAHLGDRALAVVSSRDGLYGPVMTDALSAAALELLESAAVATVATINADGSPHLSAAWIGIEDGEIVFGTLPDQRKLRNLRADPRIAIQVQSDRVNEWGLREYLVIDGTARITEGGAAALLQRLARIYISPDVVFPAMPDPPPGYVTHVRVDRVSGIGPWRRSAEEEEST